MRKSYHYWTDEKLHQELIQICAGTGVFPSNQDLIKLGRQDLSNQIVRRGGFIAWSKRLGYRRKESDSDKGWDGELKCIKKLAELGFKAEKTDRVRSPYDILVNECLRIDVKTAKYAEYGACRGWFYRLGKNLNADLIMLYQADTEDAYYVPWTCCPTTNITISRNGGKYANFKNNVPVLSNMATSRFEEMKAHSAVIIPRGD